MDTMQVKKTCGVLSCLLSRPSDSSQRPFIGYAKQSFLGRVCCFAYWLF